MADQTVVSVQNNTSIYNPLDDSLIQKSELDSFSQIPIIVPDEGSEQSEPSDYISPTKKIQEQVEESTINFSSERLSQDQHSARKKKYQPWT